jgi:hypothetical protein
MLPALLGAVTVIVDAPEPVMVVVGLGPVFVGKLAVAPLGSPTAVSVTGPLKLLVGLTETVKVAEPPTIVVAGLDVGVRVMVKSGGGTTVIGPD